ncbi:hypothetical protein [Lysobacter sp. Hz 25]|uniref:hypothetical protein n=1 Tax=Lysobacter sp. Hz 25 TaxID=3383698 RepID=UPI0038D393D4
MAATTLTVAATAYAAKKQGDAAKSAGKSGQQAAQLGIDEQRAAREQFQTNIAPYLGAGSSALSRLEALNNGDFSSFKQSPDYQFAFDQGMKGLDRSAAANGGLYSGGADADRIAFGQGLATQNYSNFYNRLADIARMGQSSAVGAGQLGQGSASAIGNLAGAGAAAAGAGAIGSANAQSNGLAGLAGIAGQYAGNLGNRQSSYGGNIGPVTRQPINMPTASVEVPRYRYGA